MPFRSEQGRDSARVRKAFPSDLAKTTYSRSAKAVYTSLCNHREKQNLAWPSVETMAGESGYSVRSVQRALAELLAGGALCCPAGDHGGRRRKHNMDEKIRGNTTIYHLHAPGAICRHTETQNLQRGRFQNHSLTVSECHPYQEPDPGHLRVTFSPDKGDKIDSAYKEEPSRLGTFSNLSTSSSDDLNSASEMPSRAIRSGNDSSDVAKAWEEIQILIGGRGGPIYVDSKARTAIERNLAQQDCSLENLVSLIRNRGLGGSWRNPVAGLIHVASELAGARTLLAHSGCEEIPPNATPGSAPFTPDELRAHLQKAAGVLSRRAEGTLQKIGRSLQSLSTNAELHVDRLEELEQQLTLMEAQVLSALRSSQSEQDVSAIREALDRELKPYRSRMTADQLVMLERRYIDTALLERAKLPRLSLFYLH